MLSLFPEEEIVTQSNEGSVTLTTHRLCYEYKDWGRAYNQNIMLEHITSCENYYSAQVWLLVLAILSLVISITAGFNEAGPVFSGAMLVALILGLIYWVSRRNFVVIASPSTKMTINMTGMKREKVLSFINTVEHTKNKRIVSLNNKAQ
jgi:hypothetical protein